MTLYDAVTLFEKTELKTLFPIQIHNFSKNDLHKQLLVTFFTDLEM